MNHLEAIAHLSTFDHCFLTEEGVKEFEKVFGLTLHTYEVASDPLETFKGLTFYDDEGKPLPAGTKRKGVDADGLAMDICTQLKVEFPVYFGRGSQLRGCCDALARHFSQVAA